ncbi:hypothetical protein Asi02nite_77880 [Asanoa siamensis]|uniref:Uncharacterized protein n=1 Tax=Asanoa siamensis TaxID=926357 RepID=A0ABQ4D403_9ACTN|nr:hypothetical protein Asi02nite_77880 [Asanoa siamensis]
MQAFIRPDGVSLWISDVMPGYEGAGMGIYTPYKQPADGRQLAIDNRTYNALHRAKPRQANADSP